MEDKPRCSTCPHALPWTPDGDMRQYLCELSPPRLVAWDPEWTGGMEEYASQFVVSERDGCFYHPDFPAWLASRAKPADPLRSVWVVTIGSAGVTNKIIGVYSREPTPVELHNLSTEFAIYGDRIVADRRLLVD